MPAESLVSDEVTAKTAEGEGVGAVRDDDQRRRPCFIIIAIAGANTAIRSSFRRRTEGALMMDLCVSVVCVFQNRMPDISLVWLLNGTTSVFHL